MNASKRSLLAMMLVLISTRIALGETVGDSGFMLTRIHDSMALGISAVFPVVMGFFAAGALLFHRRRVD